MYLCDPCSVVDSIINHHLVESSSLLSFPFSDDLISAVCACDLDFIPPRRLVIHHTVNLCLCIYMYKFSRLGARVELLVFFSPSFRIHT